VASVAVLVPDAVAPEGKTVELLVATCATAPPATSKPVTSPISLFMFEGGSGNPPHHCDCCFFACPGGRQPLSFLASPGGQSARLPMVDVSEDPLDEVDALPLAVPEPLAVSLLEVPGVPR
jgi:hypothetical protein